MFYVQYDENGNIGGTVITNNAPICERQLSFDEPFDTAGKMVDLATLTLIDAPIPEPTLDDLLAEQERLAARIAAMQS